LLLEREPEIPRLGEIYLLVGRLEEAMYYTQQQLEFACSNGELGRRAWSLRILGEIVARQDPQNCELAASYYDQALALADELGMRPLQAHCHHGLGTLYRHTGQAEQAYAELSTAIQMYRDMEMMFWLPHAEAALSEI
jgi:tetratricopeptide (TPR) repeat protein